MSSAEDVVHAVGHFGGRNFGDELMLEGVRAVIGLRRSRTRVASWTLRDVRALIAELSRSRDTTVLLVTGSTFHDLYPPRRAVRQAIAKVGYVAVGAVARATGHRVVFLGSIGPSWRLSSGLLDVAVLGMANRAVLRDESSIERIPRFGPRGGLVVFPDIALAALVEQAERSDRSAATRPWGAREVVLVPANDRQFPSWSYPLPQVVASALVAAGFRAARIVLSHSSSSTDSDAEAQGDLVRELRSVGLTTSFGEMATGPGSLADAVREMSHADLVIGSRLHPSMVALASGVPTVLAPYHPKVVEVLEPVFGPQAVAVPGKSSEELAALIEGVLAQPRPASCLPEQWIAQLGVALVGP